MNFEKDAGGEILGGLAGLLSRPFVGAARSGAVRQGIVDSVTRNVNDPLERLLHRAGVGKAVETGARALAYPVPEWVPLAGRLREKSLTIPKSVPLLGGRGTTPFLPTPEARAAWAKDKANNFVNLVAQHPDAAAFSGATTVLAPIPGITEVYLTAKGVATKALEKLSPGAQAAAAAVPRALPPLPAEPTFLKLPPKIAAAYVAGQRAALDKFAADWSSLTPALRRALIGGAVGTAGGAAIGASVGEDGERGRAALKGGLLGAVLGAVPPRAMWTSPLMPFTGSL